MEYEKVDGSDNVSADRDIQQMGVSTKEEATLVPKTHPVTLETAVKLRRAAIIVSWISIIITFTLAVVTFVVSVLKRSSSSFAFAFDAILDCLTSMVVIWRYHGNATKSLYSKKRERLACIVLGLLFVLSFIIIVVKIAESIVTNVHPSKSEVTLYIALANSVICLLLVFVKCFLGRRLESQALITDAYNSAVGALMGFTTFVSAFIYEYDNHVWYIDDIVGMACAAFLLGYGISLLIGNMKKKGDEAESDSDSDQT